MVEFCHLIGQTYLLDFWRWNPVTWLVRFTY